jgi:hypothetical protein
MINIYVPHDRYQLSKNKRYLDLFPDGSLYINPRSSSQQRRIWIMIIIKQHAKEDILDKIK